MPTGRSDRGLPCRRAPLGDVTERSSTPARLARNEEKKEDALKFLLRQTGHLKESVRLAAFNALGQLADPKAIPVLETFARAAKENPAMDAAKQALTEIRAHRKPADEWRDLRQEILDLQKENRELKKSLDDLRKRLDQVAPPGLSEKPAPGKSKQKKQWALFPAAHLTF